MTREILRACAPPAWLALLLSAACTFDPPAPIAEADAEIADARGDGGPRDARPLDAQTRDAEPPDAERMDMGTTDLGGLDAEPEDAADAGDLDAEVEDAEAPRDAEPRDAELDAGFEDAAPDAEPVDTGPPDTGSPDAAAPDATPPAPLCGNGVFDGAETCDDGNLLAGDGCSPACAVEPGFVCAQRSPSRCYPAAVTRVVDSARPCPGAGTDQNPFCHISSIDNVISGVVILRAGVHPGGFNRSGGELLIVGDEGAEIVTSGRALRTTRSARVSIIGVDMRGATGGDVVEITQDSRVGISESTIGPSAAHGVHTKDDSHLRLSRSVIIANGRGGLELDGGSFEIVNSLIVENTTYGARISRTSTSARFSFNTVASNVGPGLNCTAGSPAIVGSIVWDNMVSFTGVCVPVWSNVHGAPPGGGVLSQDPMFSASDPYHLTPGSPCIDAFGGAGAPSEDLDGDARPQGLAPDMGADEAG